MFGGYKSPDYYDDYHDSFLEVEIPRTAFHALVGMEEEYHCMRQDERYERIMQKTHPAIKEAYEKYQMLLELYK